MPNDLIAELRSAAETADGKARKLFLDAVEEIQRCHERLEITHVYEMDFGSATDDASLLRKDVPYAERKEMTDGIECRDLTIAMLEGKL